VKLEIRISGRARRDFAAILEYVQERNPAAADRPYERVGRTINLLAQFPGIGQPTVRPGIFMSSVPRYGYKIYYFARDDALNVIHIRHPARRDPKPEDL
jgi:plasmid stabilization system protein ParE